MTIVLTVLVNVRGWFLGHLFDTVLLSFGQETFRPDILSFWAMSYVWEASLLSNVQRLFRCG